MEREEERGGREGEEYAKAAKDSLSCQLFVSIFVLAFPSANYSLSMTDVIATQ